MPVLTSLLHRMPPAALAAATLAGLSSLAAPAAAELQGDGLLRTRSAYPVEETAARLKADIEGKGIMFFAAIDQGALAEGAGIALPPSQLLLFGNPPLGITFLTADPESGIDWPVRMLVHADADGTVWVVYQDWPWVAARHGITSRNAEFAKATEVVTSILEAVADCAPVATCTE